MDQYVQVHTGGFTRVLKSTYIRFQLDIHHATNYGIAKKGGQ